MNQRERDSPRGGTLPANALTADDSSSNNWKRFSTPSMLSATRNVRVLASQATVALPNAELHKEVPFIVY